MKEQRGQGTWCFDLFVQVLDSGQRDRWESKSTGKIYNRYYYQVPTYINN